LLCCLPSSLTWKLKGTATRSNFNEGFASDIAGANAPTKLESQPGLLMSTLIEVDARFPESCNSYLNLPTSMAGGVGVVQ
jgi:hypothetical protein